MKNFLSCICIILLFNGHVSAQNFSGPESVEFDPVNNRYIVSNTTSGNLQFVVPGQSPVLFAPGVSSPYGLVVVDSTVYVNSSGMVKGYNLVNGLQTFIANVGGAFLNGICADTSGHLYTTDFNAKKIYKVNISDGSSWVYVNATTKTPNGILFDAAHNRLVYCTWGGAVQIKAVNLTDSSQTILKTTTLSNDDGIAMDNAGRFYISVWGTQSIYMLDSSFLNPPMQVITGLSNPADIYYNLNNDTLAVPNSGNNTVNFYNMNYITGLGHAASVNAVDFLHTKMSGNHVQLEWSMRGDGMTLEIYNVEGALISSREISNSGKYLLEPGSLSTGIYIARIFNSEHALSEKFFVD